MSVIGMTMSEDAASSPLAGVMAPVRRWPERRSVVLLSAGVLFVTIFALRELVSGTGDALSLLYVIPVALLALELGMRAGAVAAGLALAAVGVWMASVSTGVGWVGLLIRALIFFSVGVIAGRFSDRMWGHSLREQGLLRSGLDLARIDEGADLRILLADHIEHAVRARSVEVRLDGQPLIQRGEQAGQLLRVPIVSPGLRGGWIEVSAGAGRRFSPEDRLTLEAIALQAAVASENRRLLAAEREQRELQEEIERMRERLGDQLRNASQVIEHHEQQRRGIARQLHDEAAQAMAGALLTVGLLERGIDHDISGAQLEEVRKQVKECIVQLRHIAGSLRPPALDEMGLAMALEHFVDLEQEHRPRSLEFSLGALPDQLPSEVETATYRVIEEMLEALQDAASVSVSVGASDGSMRITVEAAYGPPGAQEAQRRSLDDVDLIATRARVELIGGSLATKTMPAGGKRIEAQIPIALEGG
jgi:signal transduction histidine kinase